MSDVSYSRQLQQAWNRVSAAYLSDGPIEPHAISYGPLSPSDDELQLLENVRGHAVLDLGCGGGENTVRFAELGARVTALDFSQGQLDRAKRRARKLGAEIHFVLDNVETLSTIPDSSQDLVFCTHVFPYVEQIENALISCRRVLRPDGRIVMSMDHPFRTCFIDIDSSDLTNYPERSYFATKARTWPFAESGVMMKSFDRSIGEWIDLLSETGFRLVRLVEPRPPSQALDDFFPVDGPLAPLRNIPHTLILTARIAHD